MLFCRFCIYNKSSLIIINKKYWLNEKLIITRIEINLWIIIIFFCCKEDSFVFSILAIIHPHRIIGYSFTLISKKLILYIIKIFENKD